MRQGRSDVGLFFLGWCIGALGIGVVIYHHGLPGFLWGWWAVACGLLWAVHLMDMKRHREREEELQRRQLVQLLFPARPPERKFGEQDGP